MKNICVVRIIQIDFNFHISNMFMNPVSASITKSEQGIIEGDQIEVAAFSLDSFAYLSGLATANNNAGSNSA